MFAQSFNKAIFVIFGMKTANISEFPCQHMCYRISGGAILDEALVIARCVCGSHSKFALGWQEMN